MVRFSITTLGGAAALLAITLAGCTGSPEEPSSTPVDFTNAAQSSTPTYVQIQPGEILVITPPDPAYLQAKYWSASIANPAVLRFSPADGSGRTASLPLFTGIEEGETTVILTYTGEAHPESATLDVTVVRP